MWHSAVVAKCTLKADGLTCCEFGPREHSSTCPHREALNLIEGIIFSCNDRRSLVHRARHNNATLSTAVVCGSRSRTASGECKEKRQLHTTALPRRQAKDENAHARSTAPLITGTNSVACEDQP